MLSTTVEVNGSLRPGARLGPYQIIRPLAVKGLAELLLAKASGIRGFEKVVALKRILPRYAASDRLVQLFLDEARVTAALHHPNIAEIYEVGSAGSTYYFALEYIEGADVRSIWQASRWAGHPIPIEHGVAIAIGAASGLSHAHERVDRSSGRPLGIVHGDLSPSSILVGLDGTVKLVDFGTARASEGLRAVEKGLHAGARAYLAPEQRRGEPPDQRSDIYALGVVLYELTTGRLLFREPGANRSSVARPAAVCPGYPRALERVVMKAMSPWRWRRHRTARALEAALEKVARELRLPVSASSLTRYLQSLDLPPSPLAEPECAPVVQPPRSIVPLSWPARVLQRLQRALPPQLTARVTAARRVVTRWARHGSRLLARMRRWSSSVWWRLRARRNGSLPRSPLD